MSLVQQGSSPEGVWDGFWLMSSGSKVIVSTSKRE